MLGKTISHYKILEKLGEGGMGVVYKAEDTKLKRAVALKFLPVHSLVSEEKKIRFLHEAQAAAALDHANICTVYEINEADGQSFISMAFVEGQSLQDLIATNYTKLQKVNKVIDYAIQIAAGLQAAHEKNIVHRDIKPANILITEKGQVKITDFGIAKLRGRTQLTREGITIGTMAYMSPEQAQGIEVDHRSDIWAFGAVLYEMLTGRKPFAGDYEQAVMYSIMNMDPEPLTDLRTGVPIQLERIVNKALAKSPDERYQHIDEILVDLKMLKKEVLSGKSPKHPATIKPPPKKETLPVLAVLPFANIRSDPQTDFLGFALADQTIGALTYLQNILVRPSSAVRQYQNKVVDVRTAARHLQVDFILTGYYLKEADVVRLNVELVSAQSNEMLWREAIEVKYEDAFKLQDIVSQKVIDGLRVKFSQNERARMQVDVPQNPLAYEYYMRGISYSFTIEGDQFAIEMLNKSIQLDPAYAPAYAELGFRNQQIGNFALGSAMHGDKIHEAEQAYLKALSLNKELLSALRYLAMLYTETARTEQAVELAKQILQINPNSASGYFSLGYVYRYAGMLKESVQQFEEALTLDPQNPKLRTAGLTYFYLGEYGKAMEVFELDPESSDNIYFKGEIYLRQNQPERAMEYFDRIIAMEPESHHGLKSKGKKAFIEGNRQEGLRVTRQWEQLRPCDSEDWYFLAASYGLLSDNAGCARTLHRAIEGGFFNYAFMLKDPFLDSARGDAEFQRVLEIAKTKHEAFRNKFFS